MNRHVGTFIGVACAALLAVWLYMTIPSVGVVAFISIFVFAAVYTVFALLRRGSGDVSRIKNAWKAVLDFFWGM